MPTWKGGHARITITLPPVGEVPGVVKNLCTSSIDRVSLPKGYQDNTDTCDFDDDLEITYTKEEQTSAGLEITCKAWCKEQLTEAEETTLFDSPEPIGPVIVRLKGTRGFYLPLATVQQEYTPGGAVGLQSWGLTIKSYGKFYRGVVAPT
jgi:hypothetical protein